MPTGAYAIEQDYSHYVARAKKTVLAVVGTATKGPVGVATLCTSTQDLVNKFGPLDPKCYALYAAQYFLSQSSKVYFVRAIDSKTAKEASIAVKGKNASNNDVLDAITFSALEKGTYADGYEIAVTKGNPIIEEDDTEIATYTLYVRNTEGVTLERIPDIDLDTLMKTDELDPSKYTFKSRYIQVTGVNVATSSLTEGSYKLAGGDNGITDYIENMDPADFINAAKSALTVESVDMNLLAVPGVSNISVINAMLAIAEARKDCLCIIDPPRGLDRDGVIKWSKGEGYDILEHSSYGALYYDWQIIYDSVNKVRVEVPPSVTVPASIAYSDRVSEVWFAPAGLNRGVIRGVLDTVTKLSKSDVDLLYDNNINSIYDDPSVGLVVWGQKTLYQGDSALDRINVRRLLNYLTRIIVAACNYLTFDPNDRITWNSFSMKVKPVLENVRKKRGIYEYRIIKGATIVTDEDIDNYRMPAMILIRPTKAAEEIPIYFTITSTGADFNEVLEANGILGE